MKPICNNSGWLIVNKPEGIESYGVIRELKFRFQFKKIGFVGTLDPLASGLLIIGINKATKKIPEIHLENKKYEVKILFGASTNTQDIEGRYIKYKKISHSLYDRIKQLKNFIGIYDQKIPFYSAHKKNGKNYYELSRDNKIIEEKYKQVQVHSIKILHQDIDTLTLKIECQTGFYIRAFAEELAKSLDDLGFAISIIRYKIGQFKLSNAIDFQNILDFSDINDLYTHIIPVYSGRHPG